MYRLSVPVLVICSGVVLCAQTAPLRLTLDDAVARGLAVNHRISEVGARIEAARAVEDQRKAADRPLVDLLGGYSRTNHVQEFGIPGGRIIYPDIPNNVRSRIDFQWPIYTGGRTSALTRAAVAEVNALSQDQNTVRADLKLEITRAYWAVITANASVDVLNQALARVGAHLNDVRNQLNVGLVPPSDVLTVEAQQARQRGLLIEAQNVAANAAIEFRSIVGLPPDTPFELSDRLDAPPALPDDAAALVAAARASRPERKALEIRMDEAAAHIAAASAGKLPTVATIGGYDVARPNPKIFPREAGWKPSWDAGVSASWNVFDGGRVRAEIAEASATRLAAEERLKDFDVNLEADVRQRLGDLGAARASITAAEAGVTSATEARRVIEDRFGAGVATNSDVIDAESSLLQAELDRTRSLADAHLAAARLDRAIGR